MQTKRPFAPGFLNKLDKRWLLHSPETWSSRIHLVAYYGLLVILGLATIAFIVPDDPREESPAGYWIGFVSIISILGLVAWLIYLLRFNVFKRFGYSGQRSGLKVFLQYFVCTGIIVLFPYVEPVVESIRANAAYSSEELLKDINTFNTRICQLEYDSLRHEWRSDTFRIVKSTSAVHPANSYPSTGEATDVTIDSIQASVPIVARDTIVLTPVPAMIPIDSLTMAGKLATADSSIRVNDSTYIIFETPEYTFLSPYGLYRYSVPALFSDMDIFRNTIQHFSPVDRDRALKDIQSIIHKYSRSPRQASTYIPYYDDYESSSAYSHYEGRMKARYHVSAVSNSISNIAERKYRWNEENLPIFFRIFYYITLGITLLVFLFRHSTVQSFFLSLLSALVLTILTALFTAFTSHSEVGLLSTLVLYFIAFFVVSGSMWSSKTRSLSAGIAQNLWVLMLPFMPLICHVLYHSALMEGLSYNSEEYTYYQNRLANYLSYAEAAGAILLAVMLAFYIRRAYRQWYALPEQ